MTANLDSAHKRNALLERIRSASDPGTLHGMQLRKITDSLSLHVALHRLEAFADVVSDCSNSTLPLDLNAFVKACISDNRLHLWGSSLLYQSLPALITLIDEILLRREYHFRSSSEAPVVIDAGANIGLATYYVHRMCKARKIVCFEPNPDTYDLLKTNSSANRWPTELHCAAVSTKDGHTPFVISNSMPLASAINPRQHSSDEQTIVVPCVRLRSLLDQPIGLLKIDIEGAEADVLEDCEGALQSVENIFCEVHPVPGQSPSLLLRVLGVLERSGYMIHVSRSPWSERSHGTMPLLKASRSYSLSVFATRMNELT